MDGKTILLITSDEFIQLKGEVLSRLDEIYALLQTNSKHKSRDDDLDLLDINELAECLGVSKTTLHSLKKKGLPFLRIGAKIRFNKRDVTNYLNNKSLKNEKTKF